MIGGVDDAAFAVGDEDVGAEYAGMFAAAGDEDIAAGDDAMAGRRQRARPRRAHSLDGDFFTWVLSGRQLAAVEDGGQAHVKGLVQLRWTLQDAQAATAKIDADEAGVLCPADSIAVLTYRVMGRFYFLGGHIPVPAKLYNTLADVMSLNAMLADSQLLPPAQSLNNFLACRCCTSAVLLHEEEAADLVHGERSAFRCVAMKRASLGSGRLFRYPSNAQMKQLFRKFRRCQNEHQLVSDDRPNEHVPAHLRCPDVVETVQRGSGDVPARLRKRFGAEQIFRALQFAGRLRQKTQFEDSLTDAWDYLEFLKGGQESFEDQFSCYDHPSARTLGRAHCRMDAVSMLIERRIWAKWRSLDRVRSIHVYIDASPVSGHEILGMAYDVVFHDEEIHRTVMPPMGLAFGGTSVVDKALSLFVGNVASDRPPAGKPSIFFE